MLTTAIEATVIHAAGVGTPQTFPEAHYERHVLVRDRFGYEERADVVPMASCRVAEGKVGDTLQPQVILYVGWPDAATESGVARLGLAMTPDDADQLADQLSSELRRWAARAREKHWE